MATINATPMPTRAATPRRWRVPGAAFSVLLASALMPMAFRPPRYTLLNSAHVVDYTSSTAAAAVGAMLLLVAAAVLLKKRALRSVAAVLAAGAAVVALGRASYRVEAGPDSLAVRELLGRTTVSWRDVTRVDHGPGAIVVWGRGETQVRIDASGFRAEQRASLDRTIARRIAEASGAGASGSSAAVPNGPQLLAPAMR